jgi:type I restriction-modification system DNA methylase subunit
VPGFCKAATLDDIRHPNHILTPGRYVGMVEVEEDDEPFEEKMAQLGEQFAEGAHPSALLRTRLEAAIQENLGFAVGNGRQLAPFCRAVEHKTIRLDHLIGEYAIG